LEGLGMLDDFIKANNVDAKIVKFNQETSMQSALFKTKISPECAIKCEFFLDENDNAFLIIHSIKTKINFEKLKKLLGVFELFEKNELEVFDATGYEKEFLPPIGIYGVKVYLDNLIHKKNCLFCKIGEKKFLKISPDAIINSNEDVVIENFSILFD
jgi:prolyl-tRNA editing enzyme YbaK/EbsC (Cys-tRNA(Pro) deacylase)